MTLWTAKDLADATGGAMTAPFDATGVSIDTRTLTPGDVFVALQGEGRDGHAFVADALGKGAAGAMVHAEVPGCDRLLRVDDTLVALGRLGAFARTRFTGKVAAVTGSVGKTTTKEMLRAALSVFGPTHAAVASYNNHWGVPLTLARLPRNAGFCVTEIGMNHAGEIAPLSRVARPHVAVITTVAKAHVGYLGSIEAIADEKAAIAAGLEPGGIAVLPADSPQFARLRTAAGNVRVLTFGASASADARLLQMEPDADGSLINANVAGATVSFRLPAPGSHMAMNAMATLGVVAALGLDPVAVIEALEAFVPLAGRGRRRDVELPSGPALLLDESYNGNGASMRAALEVLRLQPAKRRIAVLGDMLELGDEGIAEHVALAETVAKSADLVFACGPLMGRLFKAIPEDRRGAYASDSAGLAPMVSEVIAAGDVVLVKGSLGSKMKHVVDAIDAAAEQPNNEQPNRMTAGAGTC